MSDVTELKEEEKDDAQQMLENTCLLLIYKVVDKLGFAKGLKYAIDEPNTSENSNYDIGGRVLIIDPENENDFAEVKFWIGLELKYSGSIVTSRIKVGFSFGVDDPSPFEAIHEYETVADFSNIYKDLETLLADPDEFEYIKSQFDRATMYSIKDFKDVVTRKVI